MPLLNRETLVDRPVLVNRGNEEDEQDTEETEDTTVETLGQGGGPTLNGIEFEPGDYNLVAGSNAAAVLATGEQGGPAFEQAFVNAAIQLKELVEQGEDVIDLARFGLEKGVAELGLTESQIEVLRQVEEEPEEDEAEAEEVDDEQTEEDGSDESESEESDEDGEPSDINEVEEDLEEVKSDDDG